MVERNFEVLNPSDLRTSPPQEPECRLEHRDALRGGQGSLEAPFWKCRLRGPQLETRPLDGHLPRTHTPAS